MYGYFSFDFRTPATRCPWWRWRCPPPETRRLGRGRSWRGRDTCWGPTSWTTTVSGCCCRYCLIVFRTQRSYFFLDVGQTNKYLACECSEDPTLFRSTVYARCHEECLVTSDRNVPTRTALDHEFFPSLKCFFNIDNFLISDGILQSQFRGMLPL